MDTYPEIRIAYNRFLDPVFVVYIKSHEKWRDWKPPTKESVQESIENYKKAWRSDETVLLPAICGITGLQFKNRYIDVHIVSGNPRPFSRPIVLKSTYSPVEFVDVLTHELIHHILSDNVDEKKLRFLNKLTERRKDSTRIHILVYAIHKKIYLEYLQSESRLTANITRSNNSFSDDYTESWRVVDEIGYENIIKSFRDVTI